MNKKYNSDQFLFCTETKKSACTACQIKIVSSSLIYHVSMTFIKAVVGIITGSKVLVAEAVHSFSDCIAFGINYSGACTKRISELVQTILIGAIMFISGVWVCSDNLATIISRIPLRPGLFALLVAGISILANVYLYMVSLCSHKKDPGNGNVFMFMVQNRTNLYAAYFGFLGIFLAVMGFVYFDPIGALFIGFFQILGSVQIFKECFEKKGAKIASTKRNLSLFLGAATLCIIVLLTQGVVTTFARRNIILIPSEGTTFDSPASSLLGRSLYFCIIDLKKNVFSMNLNKSRYYNVEENIVLGAIVKENNVGVILAGNVGPKMFSTLRERGIRIYYFNSPSSVGSVFSDYQAGRLEIATSANTFTGFGRSKVQWLRPW